MKRAWAAVGAAVLMSAVVSTGSTSEASGSTSEVGDGGFEARFARTSTSVPMVSTGSTNERSQLRRRGRWLVDGKGRVVIIHGLNLVWKHAPYVPPNTKDGFMKRDAKWLADHGFNGARIGTLWAGVTPKAPGKADPTYFKRWQRIMDLLTAKKIYLQLDAHQDMWHETYGGEGVPQWAVRRPPPFNLLPPVNAPFPLGYWTPEVSTVFDNFWANKDGLLDGWISAWTLMAKQWRNQPYLMGYDLINEPWMGLEWPTCLTTGCAPSYKAELQPALEKATRAIRAIDRTNIVWWEPQQFAGGRPLDTFFTAPKNEKQLGFSWHNYCPDVFFESQGIPAGNVENCRAFSAGRQQHALKQSAEMNAVPLMTEWGATDNVRAIQIDAQVADKFLMGWTHWAYKFWRDPTTADGAQGLFTNDRDLSSTKNAKVRQLVRTYAQATAGTPTKMLFRPKNGYFDFTYRPNRKITAPTDIFISPLHYPKGRTITVRNGQIVKQSKTHLLVEATSNRPVTVQIYAKK